MTTDPDDATLVALGNGPVATVLAGVDPTSGEAYALKVFPGPFDRRTRSRLHAELGRLAGLAEHAPVLVATGFEDLPDGRSALRMEVAAQSLPQLLDSFGPLSVSDALALAGTLAAALAAIHGIGLTHGGVTPGNVLFRSSGEPVLADAGRTLRDAFPPDRALAADQLAPETVRDATIDERSDLYGLGAIVYLALTGRSPYRGPAGEQPSERLLRILSTPAPPLDRTDLPPGLAELIAELLAKDPGQRPGDAAAVLRRLDAMSSAIEPLPDVEVPTAAAGPPPAPPGPAAFDDFAAAYPPPPPPPAEVAASQEGEPLAAPRPLGAPILSFGPSKPRRRIARGSLTLVLAAVAVTALVAITATLLMVRPDGPLVGSEPSQGATASSTPSTRAVRLELAEPIDGGTYVELSWTSSEPLDFGVVVAEEGKAAWVQYAHNATSYGATNYRISIDPVHPYCFQIRGSDGGPVVFTSTPKQIRHAVCRE